ncbi:MAG TPA: zinc ribbon domain-containing protein [Candidatus Bathyarchaeia archaeon]|nr:zinc ribbon domain-containing protein [Candidatus Bathyarchaeia archaeon]
MIGNFDSYCPFCGINIERDSRYCHNCGASLEHEKVEDSSPSIRIISERPLSEFPNIDIKALQQKHQTRPLSAYHQGNYHLQNSSYSSAQNTANYTPKIKKQNDGLGVISLIFAILAITSILPFIGSIVAIILGGEKSGTVGIIGRIIGIFSLIIYSVLAILIIL